jgi:hypothetical protein
MWTAGLVGAGTRERDAGHHRGPTAPGAPCNHRAPRRAMLDGSARCSPVRKKNECFAERDREADPKADRDLREGWGPRPLRRAAP